jgi:hypothetical protein
MAMTPEQKAAKAKEKAKAQKKLLDTLSPKDKAQVLKGLSTRSPEAKAALSAAYKSDKAAFGSRIATTKKTETKITADMHLKRAQRLLAEAQKAQAAAKAAAAAAAKAAKATGPKAPRGGSGLRGGSLGGGGPFGKIR